jgi:hypothetical protein
MLEMRILKKRPGLPGPSDYHINKINYLLPDPLGLAAA